MIGISVKKLDKRAVLPKYGSEYAAGADLYAVTDGEILFEPNETKLIHTGLAMEIPEGFVFVMGDNRNNSRDSRDIGFIDQRLIVGRSVLRIFPFDRFGTVS